MNNPLTHTRMVYRARGVELPDITTDIGIAANLAWVELLRRERQLDTSRVIFDSLTTYTMSGLPPNVEYEKRVTLLMPVLQKVLAEIDQSAYGVSYKRRALTARLKELDEQRRQQALLDRVTADDFDLTKWARGEYHASTV